MNNSIYIVQPESHSEDEAKLNDNINGNGSFHSSDNKDTVVVTGASGFVASWTIKYLLEKGYRVIGTVRGDPTSDKYKWIIDLDESNNNLISLVQADLLLDGVFDECIERADYVLHIASPYITSYDDPQKELVDPAVNGTLNVLKSCLKYQDKIKRVVITSSMAAITDSPVKKYTEADWNETSSLTRNAYYYSKKMAEKSAWNFYEKENPDWTLCVVNPWMVIGPELNPSVKQPNPSNMMTLLFIIGAYPVRLNFSLGYVDVRDVALAHILVMEKIEAAGRYLCAAEVWHWNDMFDYLEEICTAENIDATIPTTHCDCNCCCGFVHCLACTQPKAAADFMHNSVNKVADFDNGKIVRLGMNFRPIKQTVRDLTIWLKKNNFVMEKKE